METMQSPTDRGYAVLFEDEKGIHLAVCASVVHGRPQEVFAVHMRVQGLDIDEGIEFVGSGSNRHTTRPVAVFGEPGVVHVKACVPSYDLGIVRVT